MSLEELRKRIDEIDAQLVDLLNERARVVMEIGKLKAQADRPIYAPDREKQVLDKVVKANKGPLPDRTLVAIWREMMSGSFVLEKPPRIAYLGPGGSFSHTAAMRQVRPQRRVSSRWRTSAASSTRSARGIATWGSCRSRTPPAAASSRRSMP